MHTIYETFIPIPSMGLVRGMSTRICASSAWSSSGACAAAAEAEASGSRGAVRSDAGGTIE